MEFTHTRTVKVVALLLLLTALTQAVYTALYLNAPEIERKIIWGLEGVIFPLLAGFAGAALATDRRYALVFSAIAFSAVFNLIQVGIGLTQFGPFGGAASGGAEFGAIAGGVFGLSFFVYNAAKVLLGLAALICGMTRMNDGAKALGGLTALVGTVALATNALVIILDMSGTTLSRVAGGSGVVTAILLALCLFSLKSDD